MERNTIMLTLIVAALWAFCSCGGDNGERPAPEPIPDKPEPRIPVSILPTISKDDGCAFMNGDKVGLFIVNRNADGTTGAILPTGNYADNVEYTLRETWLAANDIYWKNTSVHADIYLYMPFKADVKDITAMPFDVATNQSERGSYRKGDLLIGSVHDVSPVPDSVKVAMSHVMSRVDITLKAGTGFTEASLADADVAVRLNNIKHKALVNIATAEVTPLGSSESIIPINDGGCYRAVVVPQMVDECNLITVTVDGTEYNLKSACNFVADKVASFQVVVGKTQGGVSVDISGWNTDGKDNGGTAE